MPESLYKYLAADHGRLSGLLDRAIAVPGQIDMVSYDAFRGGLLRHIAMEERTLFRAVTALDTINVIWYACCLRSPSAFFE